MRQMWRRMVIAAGFVVFILGLAKAATAADFWFDIPLDQLSITQGKLPAPTAGPGYIVDQSRLPYVVLDGSGEAFAAIGNSSIVRSGPVVPDHLVIHTTDGKDVTGKLFVSNGDKPGMTAVSFKVTAAAAKAEARTAFHQMMRDHYEDLLSEQIPGAAYFRRRANEAAKALKIDPAKSPWTPNRPAMLDDTFSLFSGDEALAENLQLDRALPPGAAIPGGDAIDIRTIAGVKSAKIDWSALIKDVKIDPDPLAKDIPADQAAVLFPDFASLLAVADEADRDGTPVLQYAEPQSQDVGCRQWYEHQLGLSLTGLGKALGKQVIDSVAITSGDPYLRSGTDVAILFKPADGPTLQKLLSLQMRLLRMQPGVKSTSGKINHLDYTGAVSDDRSVSSYEAQLKDGTIVVTNSLAQLTTLDAVEESGAASIAAQPEYTFFRSRYHRGDAEESALVVLTDAAIRRWCGPRERIADSRRTRAAAVLADLNARYLDKLVAGNMPPTMVAADYSVPEMGDITLTRRGADSSTYGSLDFLTPISELKIDTVTEAEEEAYERWRDSYERYWRGMFDPIAVRLGVHGGKLSADLTVRPLILGSDYASIANLAAGVKLNPASRDEHPALFTAGIAVNVKSELIRSESSIGAEMAPALKANPYSWLGPSVWLYADDDPFWADLGKAKDQDAFVEANFYRLPMALNLEVSDGLKLAMFLAGTHAFVDQSAPGMTVWENLTYKDQPYVKVSPSAQTKGTNKDLEQAAVYYRATGKSLLITLSEPLLKRAIDRAAAKAAGKPPADSPAPPVLGDSIMLQAAGKAYDYFADTWGMQFQSAMQQRSWGNLPILNEFRRLYPGQDPVAVYAKFFHATLIDPAGGEYTWNDQWQTMQSSVYGCPADPKTGPPGVSALTGLLAANFGVTFEDTGLRAKAAVDRK